MKVVPEDVSTIPFIGPSRPSQLTADKIQKNEHHDHKIKYRDYVTIFTWTHWITTIPATSSTPSHCISSKIITSITGIGCSRVLSSGRHGVTVHDHPIGE